MTSEDHALARDLAEQAGRRLVQLRAQGGHPDVLRKAGDRLSHEFLTAELAGRRPGDCVLSEEGADHPARLAAGRVWIVDPLDGTREFGEPGRTDWAVHVALWERSVLLAPSPGGTIPPRPPLLSFPRGPIPPDPPWESLPAPLYPPAPPGDLTAGAVALPAQGRVLSTLEPPAGPDEGGASGRIRIAVSRSRAPQLVRNISGLINAELVPLGSAGAKVAAVIGGEADAYVHGGGFYEWDTAAPVAVARAAGFHASRIDGSPLAYNQADLLMPDILVCRPGLAPLLLQAIREVTDAS
jgi:3'(2'), 5'-bisphosphate nucleotidase